MKTITTNNRTLLFMEVPSPSDGGGFRIESNTFRYEQYGWKGWRTESKELPSGNYRLIATTDTITEEQAAMFVDNWDGSHKATTFTISPLIEMVQNLSIELGESITLLKFKSLLQHHSITGRHAIIEVL